MKVFIRLDEKISKDVLCCKETYINVCLAYVSLQKGHAVKDVRNHRLLNTST